MNVKERSKVKTNTIRAVYDKETIIKILDDSFLCHISFVVDNQPFVIPTCYGRDGDKIFFHGAKGSRMLKTLKAGAEICLVVSILDGIVLARSAFNHTINYRSVMIFGRAEEVDDSSEKNKALKVITEHIIKERWDDVRKPNEKELNATTILSLGINEASAKVRSGPPLDNEEDLQAEVWAGEIPLKLISEKPLRDNGGIIISELPDYIKRYNKMTDF